MILNANTGLNKLKGFDVTEFHIMLEPVNGRNMNGTVYIPNPSVMTITMVRSPTHQPNPLPNNYSSNMQQGNVTLDLSIAGQPMGYSYLDNLVLKPGNNTIPMTSNVNQSAIISLVTSSSNPYKDGMVPFTITGNSSVYNGKELPYFTQALASNNLTVNLNVTKALAEIGIHL